MHPASGSGTEPRISTLPNGLRVVSEEVPGLSGVTMGIWLGFGSIHERPGSGRTPSEYGGMHFLEHVLFKGTDRLDSHALAGAMDRLGAEFNAFTGKEHTCFHAQVPAIGRAATFALLATVVAEGACRDADVEVERGVIADELAGRDDDPEDLAAEFGCQFALPDHPLGRSILGDPEDLHRLTGATLRALHRRVLDPTRIVVAMVGPVAHEQVVADVDNSPLARLEAVPLEQTLTETAFDSPRLRAHPGGLYPVRVPGQQLHLCLSALGPAREDALRPATHVATAVLGGGVSSRLFQQVRERQGVAYNVFAGVEQFGPASLVQVAASAPVARAAELMTAVAAELQDLATSAATEDEIDRAIGYLRGAILLGQDDPMARMVRLGRHLLERGRVHSVAESVARLEAVSGPDVRAAWEQVTATGWHTVVLGPHRTGALVRLARPVTGLAASVGSPRRRHRPGG